MFPFPCPPIQADIRSPGGGSDGGDFDDDELEAVDRVRVSMKGLPDASLPFPDPSDFVRPLPPLGHALPELDVSAFVVYGVSLLNMLCGPVSLQIILLFLVFPSCLCLSVTMSVCLCFL